MLFNHEIKVLQLRVILKSEDNGTLPAYLGSTIRGVLGHAMRRQVCIAPKLRCHLCNVAENCDYAKHFNSPGNIAGSVNPFVIHVPIKNKRNWQRNDLLIFDITIFGSSTLAASYYISSILSMGEYGLGVNRLLFSPVQIINLYDNTLVWSNGRTWEDHLYPYLLRGKERTANSVTLRFDSPTRILVKRKLQKRLTFMTVIQSLFTRIQLLFHAYEGIKLNIDEEKWLEKAVEIRTVEEDWQFVDFERYSYTYNRKLQLPAIEGYVRYEGNLTPFTPILEMGKVIQIGKNTTHGFGHYELYYA